MIEREDALKSAGSTRRVVLADGAPIELIVRRSPRARRLLLQVAPIDGAVELVLPPGAPLAEGLAFARSKTRWIRARAAGALGRVPFVDGAVFPCLGSEIRIQHVTVRGAVPWRERDDLYVPGHPEDVPARVRRWVKAAARDEIVPRVRDKAARLGRLPGRIAVRDTRSRWGSCSSAGNLNFSWRLVLAPESVLDYVVAHEVAHLAELNHGKRFWAHVDVLCDDPKRSRDWLRRHGAGLHRYG